MDAALSVTPEILRGRLTDLAHELSLRDDALALLALGSVGIETHRLDAFSDLDFFVLVKDGAKARYLQRHARGEKLAAMRAIQVHALDRVLEFLEQGPKELSDASVTRDPYNVDRRIEARHAQLIHSLPLWAGGYENTVPAALALLGVLQSHAKVPEKVALLIVVLASRAVGSIPDQA